LRYDLTVPLARVVAQYESRLTLPFKRYHIAPVWRGERPQRGRYREFYQCDADIVGVKDLAADAEVVALTVMALRRLGFPQFTVKINNRKLLTEIGKFSGVPDAQLADLYRSVDKFDKIGAPGVSKELRERGIAEETVARMMDLLQAHAPGLAVLDNVQQALGDVDGLRELRDMAAYLEAFDVPAAHYAFDFTMVRGLGYYTGPIFETAITEPNLGSVAGGGRYDDLIGLFRRESLPTVGTSLGIERLIDVLEELKLYPAHLGGTVIDLLVTVFSADTRAASLRLSSDLRAAGVAVEVFMQDKALGKQFAHADKKGIPLVAVMGPDELAAGTVRLKRLRDGAEVTVPRGEAADRARALLA
jgi:histidyl-tRNA synthetase